MNEIDVAERRRQWRVNSLRYKTRHREEINARVRNANADTIAARRAASTVADPAKKRAQFKLWYTKNIDRQAETRDQRRLRQLGASGGSISVEERQTLRAESLGICTYCNRRCPLTLDHIDPLTNSGEHCLSNATMCCRPCNASKSTATLIIWLARLATDSRKHGTLNVG